MSAEATAASPPAKRQRRVETASDARVDAERVCASNVCGFTDLVQLPRPLATADADGDDDDDRADRLAFRLTRLRNAPDAHNKHTIGLRDLLSGAFSKVLLTNYIYDVPWLVSECPRLLDVPVVLVHGERDVRAMANECRSYVNISVVAPPLPIPYGTHHTKMMVVVYPSKVRVAIFTANFVASDWDSKTQGVWHQDFGLKTLSSDSDDDASASSDRRVSPIDFETDLANYLSRLGAPVAAFCRTELARFDFSSATVALIPSVPGVHRGSDMDKYGHLRVRKLLQLLRVPASNNPLICQFSSLGSLDEKWLFGEFASSLLKGKHGVTAAAAPIQALHLIWPSVDDVRNSVEGWNSGRSVPCPRKNLKPFLHKYLRKWTPPACLYRQRAMPHIKTYARFDPSAESDRAGTLDWAILTSANLSKAAWGAFQRNGSQFMIRSYELGVLFLPKQQQQPNRLVVVGSSAAAQQTRPLTLLPLPYSFPLATYDPKVDEPWVWDLVRDDPDMFGNCYLPS